MTRTPWEEWRPAPIQDGRFVYHIANPQAQFDLFRLDRQTREITKVYGTAADEWDPRFAPSSNAVVFAASEADAAPKTRWVCTFGQTEGVTTDGEGAYEQ